MLFAAALMIALPDLVPARWSSSDPASLNLVQQTPINCLLVEENRWSGAFNAEAQKRGITMLAVVRPKEDSVAGARRAVDLRFAGAVLEGTFSSQQGAAVRRVFAEARMPAIDITARPEMKLDGSAAVVGTFQGVWPGIQLDEGGHTKAAPSGSPWIDTNTGFLRFLRASTTSTIWMANVPPHGKAYPVERYLQAIGDAAMVGARWVVALDADFEGQLLAGDKRAVERWIRMGKVLEYFEAHKEWRKAEPFARLALVQDVDSGALLSGGILDMIAVKHTPVRPVPNGRLDEKVLASARMAVNVDPQGLTPAQKDVLKAFTRTGGTLLTGPPGWKFPQPLPNQITLEKEDLKKLDDIWRELNSMTGRKNLGARLFNVSSMLSDLTQLPSSGQVILNLVNYSDFGVENVTVHVLGTYRAATLFRPDGPAISLAGYPVEEGTGFDIDRVGPVATLVLAP